MLYLHLFMSAFGIWRLVEVVQKDSILRKPRTEWFPNFYLWKCDRCVSVWAGIYATLAFAFYQPALFVLWPFAFSMLYLIINGEYERLLWWQESHVKKGVFVDPLDDGRLYINARGFTQPDAINILRGVVKMYDNEPRPNGGLNQPVRSGNQNSGATH